MALLLARSGDNAITEKVVVAAARNPWCGKQMLESLLDYNGEIMITEEMLKAAAIAPHGKEVLTLLLDCNGNHDHRGDVKGGRSKQFNRRGSVGMVARLWWGDRNTRKCGDNSCQKNPRGPEVIALLLGRGYEITVTEDIVRAAKWRESLGKLRKWHKGNYCYC
jgi:hypothetical protein